jgi:hypothetical protein
MALGCIHVALGLIAPGHHTRVKIPDSVAFLDGSRARAF